MADPVVRVTVLEQVLPTKSVRAVEVRRITLQPGVSGGAHRHNGPVFGVVEAGSVIFEVEGDEERVLRAGDVFYEPADVIIRRWDATAEGVTFLGYFLLGADETPELMPAP